MRERNLSKLFRGDEVICNGGRTSKISKAGEKWRLKASAGIGYRRYHQRIVSLRKGVNSMAAANEWRHAKEDGRCRLREKERAACWAKMMWASKLLSISLMALFSGGFSRMKLMYQREV